MAQWVIGLTGPTGAGKSIVGGVFADHGCAVVDTDRIARQVTGEDKDCLKALQDAFGEDVVKDGALDRQELARRAFSTPGGGERLNRITHPRILKRADEIIAAEFARGAPLALLDAPLLYESGADKICRKVVAVIAPAEIRIDRIIKRDHISLEVARLRLSAQKDDAFYTSRADYVLVNDGAPEQLREKAAQVMRQIRREQKETP